MVLEVKRIVFVAKGHPQDGPGPLGVGRSKDGAGEEAASRNCCIGKSAICSRVTGFRMV